VTRPATLSNGGFALLTAGPRTTFVSRPREKGPHDAADRNATGFDDLADRRGCP
jgi:hypothetical protein